MPKGKKRGPPDQSEPNGNSKSQKRNGGKTPIKEGTTCSVCCKTIVDQSSNYNGEDSIYCEGRCGWIHRQCAGLSDPFFKLFTDNDSPFYVYIAC